MTRFPYGTVQYNTVRNGDVRYGTSHTLHPKPYIKKLMKMAILLMKNMLLLLMLNLVMLKMMSDIDNDDSDANVDAVHKIGLLVLT